MKTGHCLTVDQSGGPHWRTRMKREQYQRRRTSDFFAEGLVEGGLKTQKPMAIRA